MVEYANEGYFKNCDYFFMKFNTDLEGKMSYIFWTKSCENGHCVTD